jgi:hypothetical protein
MALVLLCSPGPRTGSLPFLFFLSLLDPAQAKGLLRSQKAAFPNQFGTSSCGVRVYKVRAIDHPFLIKISALLYLPPSPLAIPLCGLPWCAHANEIGRARLFLYLRATASFVGPVPYRLAFSFVFVLRSAFAVCFYV